MPINPGAPVQNGVHFGMQNQGQGRQGQGVSYPPLPNGGGSQQQHGQQGNHWSNQGPPSGASYGQNRGQGRSSNRW